MMVCEEASSTLPRHISERLRLPLIAAPMFRVSGPDLVAACCRAGIIGSFPTINARSSEQLEEWLARFAGQDPGESRKWAPWAANVVMRDPRSRDDLSLLRRYPPEIAIASVGSPRPMVEALADVGTMVFADVATLRHAEKAIEAGAAGLILLSGGAGGNTGHLNPFAFVRAVRSFWSGPLILAGGVIDGVALRAMRVLGCDLGYAGTRFIGAVESMADASYGEMLVASSMDDVVLTRAFTGLDSNMLAPSIRAAGLDPSDLGQSLGAEAAKTVYSLGSVGPKRWKDIWSAGHTVSGVRRISTVEEIVEEIRQEYLD